MQPKRFGATFDGEKTTFSVWAPSQADIKLRLRNREPISMQKSDDGWHETVADCLPGDHYQYVVGDVVMADPAASAQSGSHVRGWSLVTDPNSYVWKTENWLGRPWREVIFFEAHPGLSGGFQGLLQLMPKLVEIGFTALELMPIAQFPGNWNWGYDGVLPFAPDRSYGSPEDLKALVDAAHGHGLMIFLDVVYNHFGPDGNFLPLSTPEFFRKDLDTPWGSAIDFRRPQVRQFYTENALTWLTEFRFDGLRLDAVHAIEDEGWLVEMAAEVRRQTGTRQIHLVLENDDNIAGLLREGFDAQWNDDYHHVLHVMLTGEQAAYYGDYASEPAKRLARSLKEGYVYQGEASPFRGGKPRGTPSADLPSTSFVNFLQNHDQVGNRAFGERLTTLTSPKKLRAAVALLLLSPQIPLVFMGEEIGSRAPFHYFVDHNPDLVEAIREGRQKEFQDLVPGGEDLPEPNAKATFETSRPESDAPDAEEWTDYYKLLLNLRMTQIIPRLFSAASIDAEAIGDLAVKASWRLGDGAVLTVATNFAETPVLAAFPDNRPLFGALRDGALPPSSTVVWLVT